MNVFVYNDISCEEFDSAIVLSQNEVTRNVKTSELTYNTVQNYYTKNSYKTSVQRGDNLVGSFRMFKQNTFFGNDEYYDNYEVEEIVNWLNSETYRKVTFNIKEREYLSEYYYMCYFNVEKIIHLNKVIGFDITMYCDSQYAYKDHNSRLVFTNTVHDKNVSFESFSDTFVYPTIEIELNGNGQFELYSGDNEYRKTIVKNVTPGDTITLDCSKKVLYTNNLSLKQKGRFNYIFPRIKSVKNKNVTLNCNLPCNMTIKYTSLHKIGLF